MHTWAILVLLVGHSWAVTVTVEVGQTATLLCPLTGTFPAWLGPPNMTQLTSNNQFTAQGMSYVNDKDLRIASARTSHAGEYRCRSTQGEAVVELEVNSFEYGISIVGARNRVVPYEPNTRVVPATNKKPLELECVVTNGFPEPQVTLTLPDTTVTLTPVVISRMGSNNTVTVTVKATIANISADLDRKQVVCKASSGNRSSEIRETLRVVYPPLLLVYSSNGDLTDDRNNGAYECTTINTWPLTDFTWTFNGSALPSNSRINSSACVQHSRTLLYNCTSQVIIEGVTKELNGLAVTCDIAFLGEVKHEYDNRISYLFPPSIAMIENKEQLFAQEGNNLTVTCSTDGANALKYSRGNSSAYHSNVNFSWMLGAKPLDVHVISEADSPGSLNGFNATQTVVFPAKKDMNGMVVTCKAKNYYSPRDVTDSAPLNVTYQPAVMVRPEFRVYIGDTVELICTADSNPVANMAWLRNGSLVVSNDIVSSENRLVYTVRGASLENIGVYSCTAENGIQAATVTNTRLIVMEKPPAPYFDVTSLGSSPSISFATSYPAPAVPRSFYIQYRASSSSAWLEVGDSIPDTKVGQQARQVVFPLPDLRAGTSYYVRVKSLDENGLHFFTDPMSFTTKDPEKTWSEEEYRNAILISVFVVFGVMLLILCGVIYLARSGRCGSSSGKSDVVAM